jgi:hypothetical protein
VPVSAGNLYTLPALSIGRPFGLDPFVATFTESLGWKASRTDRPQTMSLT